MSKIEKPIGLAWERICELGYQLGERNLKDRPGCWEHAVDEHWWVAFNAHAETTRSSHCVEVGPFSVYIEFDGLPFGFVAPYDGQLISSEYATEDALIEAVQRRLDALP